MLKRRLAKQNLQTKDDLENALETCNSFIDHLFKVVSTVILILGRATADIPRKVFPKQDGKKCSEKILDSCFVFVRKM